MSSGTRRGLLLAITAIVVAGVLIGVLVGVLVSNLREADGTGAREVIMLPDPDRPELLSFGSDGRTLVTAAKPTALKLWKLDRLPLYTSDDAKVIARPSFPLPISKKKEYQTRYGLGITAVALSPDGKTIAVGVAAGPTFQPYGGNATYGMALLWDVAAGAVRAANYEYLYRVAEITFSPDGKLFAVLADRLEIRETATNKVAHDSYPYFPPHPPKPPASPSSYSFTGKHIVFGPNSKTVAVGLTPGVGLLDLTARKSTILNTADLSEQTEAIAFSPDGKFLATSGRGRKATVRLWDVATGSPVADFPTDDPMVAFSPDGKFLATAGGDGDTAHLWRVATREHVAAMPKGNHFPPFTDIAFSPDGATVALAVEGVVLWNLTRYTDSN